MGKMAQWADSGRVGSAPRSGRAEELPMQSLLIAALFVGMLLSPCVVAMFSGIE
jgi:hypothetical protein